MSAVATGGVGGGERRRRSLRRVRRRWAAAAGLARLRVWFAVLQAFAPDAAVRRAADVWCVLPKGAQRRRDLRPGPGEVLRIPVPRGGRVVAEMWGEGPVVLLMHGWGGWRGQLGAFVEPLREAGFRVVAVDAPGHGDADAGILGPRRGTGIEMADAVEAVESAVGPSAGVVAHSFGCTAIGVALRGRFGVRRAVLVAPSPGLPALLDNFARMLRLNRRTVMGVHRTLEGLAGMPLDAFDPLGIGADVEVPRTLVVHDRSDKEVAHAVGEAVARAWKGARLMSTDGLGHHRLLGDDAVVRAAVEHLAEVAGEGGGSA